MVSESERMKILEMINAGTITAEEGMTLLAALEDAPDIEEDDASLEIDDEIPDAFPAAEDISVDYDGEPEPYAGEVEVVHPDPIDPPAQEDMEKWKRWWVIPLWVGIGITVIGGLLMYWAFSANGFGFWFACSWFPFLLGVGVLALAWGSKTAPWLHVRVQQAPGETPQRIAISFPIPVGLTTLAFRLFGHYIPNMGGVDLEEIIMALKTVAKEGTPFYVNVDEGENGEKVQVFIG